MHSSGGYKRILDNHTLEPQVIRSNRIAKAAKLSEKDGKNCVRIWSLIINFTSYPIVDVFVDVFLR